MHVMRHVHIDCVITMIARLCVRCAAAAAGVGLHVDTTAHVSIFSVHASRALTISCVFANLHRPTLYEARNLTQGALASERAGGRG